jgi:hypothetical protein
MSMRTLNRLPSTWMPNSGLFQQMSFSQKPVFVMRVGKYLSLGMR